MWRQVWTFLTSHYEWFVVGSTAVVATCSFILNVYSVRKARLELQKLRKELDDRNTSLVSKVTLDEIEAFASQHPSAKDVRRFIKLNLKRVDEGGNELVLSRADVNRYTDAIATVDKPLSEDAEFYHEIFDWLVRVVAYLLVMFTVTKILYIWLGDRHVVLFYVISCPLGLTLGLSTMSIIKSIQGR